MPRKIFKLPVDHLSHSSVEKYLTCPKSWEWQYLVRPEGISTSEARLVGSALHHQMAELLLAKANRTSLTLEQAQAGLVEELESKLTNLLSIRPTAGFIPSQEIKVAIELLEEWHAKIYRNFHADADKIEKKIEVEIAGYPFLGFIDAIDYTEKEMVIDWKVTKSAKTQSNADTSLQLSTYAIATGIRNVGFCSLVKPRANAKNWKPSVQLVTSTRVDHQLKWAEEVIAGVAEGIGRKAFPPCSPSAFLCNEKYCDFWFLCRGKGQQQYNVEMSEIMNWTRKTPFIE